MYQRLLFFSLTKKPRENASMKEMSIIISLNDDCKYIIIYVRKISRRWSLIKLIVTNVYKNVFIVIMLTKWTY